MQSGMGEQLGKDALAMTETQTAVDEHGGEEQGTCAAPDCQSVPTDVCQGTCGWAFCATHLERCRWCAREPFCRDCAESGHACPNPEPEPDEGKLATKDMEPKRTILEGSGVCPFGRPCGQRAWLARDATEHSKQEWQRPDRVSKESGRGRGRGRGQEGRCSQGGRGGQEGRGGRRGRGGDGGEGAAAAAPG